MGTKIIHLWSKRGLPYCHIVCGDCKGNQFYAEMEPAEEHTYHIKQLICCECGNSISMT